MSSTALTPARSLITAKQKVGLTIAGFYSLANIPSFLGASDPGQEGPPRTICTDAHVEQDYR